MRCTLNADSWFDVCDRVAQLRRKMIFNRLILSLLFERKSSEFAKRSAVFIWNRLKKKKFVSFELTTSEIEVPFDSGVTSSFVSNPLASSALFPRGCTQGSHPCLDHQGTWFPGINKFISWLAIVDDDEDEAEVGAPSAKPPSPPRTHQPPGWSRLNTTITRTPFPPVPSSKSWCKIVGWLDYQGSLAPLSHISRILPRTTRISKSRLWSILGQLSPRSLSGYLNPAAILEFSYFSYFDWRLFDWHLTPLWNDSR